MTIIVPLKDIVLDPTKPVNLIELPVDEAVGILKKLYGFLSNAVNIKIDNGIAVIDFLEAGKHEAGKATAFYDEGVREAEKGKYHRAILLFQKVLNIIPQHTNARRNLGMAYMEIGNYDEAKNHLIEVLRLDPQDAWAYLILGNIYAKHDNDLLTAEKFYLKTYELNPKDSYMLNNYAALLMETKKYREAENLFNEALAINPKYPNSYYGLALAYWGEDRTELALTTLDDLFNKAYSTDPRSYPVYAHARQLYQDVNLKIAQNKIEMMNSFIEDRITNLEHTGNHRLIVTKDDTLEYVTARTQMAWKHNRDYHEIRFKSINSTIQPHIIAHEMEHIHLEYEARKIGRNRIFISTADTRSLAIKSIGDHVYKLKSLGYSDDDITHVTLKMVNGIIDQLFNTPLDMVIERRLFESYDILRSSQFLSLLRFTNENLAVLKNKEIKKLTPDVIYKSNIAMNIAYALCVDSLYDGKTDYASHYKGSNYYETGVSLYRLWQETMKNYRHGDEYLLIDEFSKILKLQSWYQWLADESVERNNSGTTNPELLKLKEPATVMYLVGALQRFESISNEEVLKIAGEIALLGQTGIDYTKPDKRYSLQSIPGEQFSGLQLLSMMYVGFQKIDPSLDTGLDFKDAYTIALKLHSK